MELEAWGEGSSPPEIAQEVNRGLKEMNLMFASMMLPVLHSRDRVDTVAACPLSRKLMLKVWKEKTRSAATDGITVPK